MFKGITSVQKRGFSSLIKNNRPLQLVFDVATDIQLFINYNVIIKFWLVWWCDHNIIH